MPVLFSWASDFWPPQINLHSKEQLMLAVELPCIVL